MIKHRGTTWSNNSTSRYILKRNENICPHTKNVLSSQKVETTQMPNNWWINKQKIIYPYNEILFGHKKEPHTTTWMSLENIMLGKRSQLQKTTYYVTPFIWNVQIRQIYRDRKESCCLGCWQGVGGVIVKGYRVSFWGDENVLKLWWWLYISVNKLKSLNYTLKWVSCMVYRLYLNKTA